MDPGDALQIWPGEASIIIAVPHDGTESLCHVESRRAGPSDPYFTNDRDAGVSALALEIRRIALSRGHRAPTVIVNRIVRSQFDANRSRDQAASDPRAAQAWEAYHHSIDVLVEQARPKPGGSGSVVFVDLHSQAIYPADVLAGPADMLFRSIGSLEERAGPIAFLRSLDASGFGVYGVSKTVHAGFADAACLFPCEIPLNDDVPDHFLDGFTSRHHRQPGVMSLQLEVHARNLWSKERIHRMAGALEMALYRQALPEQMRQ